MTTCAFCGDPLPEAHLRVTSVLAIPGRMPHRDRFGLAIGLCDATCLQGWTLTEDPADLQIPAELIEPLMRRSRESVAERASIEGEGS